MTTSETSAGKIQWHRRIGNRVVLTAILAAVIPLLLLGGTIAIKVRHDLVRQTVASQKNLTATLLHGINSLFQNYRQQIQAIAVLPDMQSMNPDKQQPIVHEFFEQQRIFFGCNVYDRSGREQLVFIRNRKDEGLKGPGRQLDLSAQGSYVEGFMQVINTGRPSFVADETSEYQQKMLFVMVPILDFVNSEEVVGVISCSISVSGPGIHEIISGFPIEKTDVLILLDRGGNLISAQGRLPEGLRGFSFAEAKFSLPESVLVDFGGITFLGTLAAVPEFSGYLLVARPHELVLEFLNHLLLDLALMLVVAFVIAVAAGFFMSRSLAEGISSLVEAIRGVASGVVSQRVEVKGDDELSEASTAFNEMLNTLEKHRMMDDIWHREYESVKKNDGSEGQNHQ
jgi:HAMP domain-containing protein